VRVCATALGPSTIAAKLQSDSYTKLKTEVEDVMNDVNMNRKFVLIFALVLCLSFMVIKVDGHNPAYDIVALYGSTPTIDGAININEWSDAASVFFNNTKVFVKQDSANLYVAFNVTDATFQEKDVVGLYIDVDDDGSPTLQPDDVGLGVFRNGTLLEANVTGGIWTITEVSGWTAAVNSTINTWQAEFNITYSKINVAAGVEKTIGVTFVCARCPDGGSPTWVCWPPNTYFDMIWNPSSWGAITSIGYNWISEFPSFLVLPILMIATLLAIMVYGRKQAV
jgi:hypothetical protein